MRPATAIAILFTLLLAGCGRPPAKPAPPVMRHLVIVSMDGTRPDVLLRANIPNIRWLMRRGSFTFWARSTEVSITVPTHTSMFTGVVPARHDVWWNSGISSYYFHYPAVPTLFELAKQHGYTTAMAVGKSKLDVLAKKDTVDYCYLPDGYANDTQVAVEAAKIIDWHRPQLLFVHLADIDATGHGAGWGSDWQVKAAEKADRAVGGVIAALRRAGILDSTVIIVTADHGGAGHGHGAEDPRSRHIPWIISGPGIRRNTDLTSFGDLTVNVEDTFTTACYLMDLPLDEDLDCKPITQAFEPPPHDSGGSASEP